MFLKHRRRPSVLRRRRPLFHIIFLKPSSMRPDPFLPLGPKNIHFYSYLLTWAKGESREKSLARSNFHSNGEKEENGNPYIHTRREEEN